MDLNILKSFARDARKELLKSVALKIEYVLSETSAERREHPKAIIELENKIKTSSKEEIIEEVSYTWFNRFIALQYMDINGFNDVQVIMNLDGKTRPEILSNAISGDFDSNFTSENTQNIVSSLLDGRSPSNDPEKESYRLLLVSFCNKLHSKMPFLFEKISDYTELLIPNDLLSKTSILAKIREVMTHDNCQDVEVVGWLYQFYISDKKDKVFIDLKKNKKITPDNIPAATQLFTPHWIVKYLLENSLGRLWMLNNPNSKLPNIMDFYIKSEQEESEFFKISSPEEIKICDPACGSGHMLTYAFDLMFQIYKEEGYSEDSIPSLILKNNLYGIEVDKRAGGLAAFALTMKARFKQKKFFNSSIKPKICILENIKFEEGEINEYKKIFSKDIFSNSLENTLKIFEETKNFGSLIKTQLNGIDKIHEKFKLKNFSDNLFLDLTHKKVLNVINQAQYLEGKYHIVVANPPYMGSKGMNKELSIFAKDNYPESKSDLFSMFVSRGFELVQHGGFLSYLTMQSWMYLGSYSNFRNKILSENTLLQMFHTGPGLFPDLGSYNVLTTAFLFRKGKNNISPNNCLFIKANDNPDISKKIKSLSDISKHIYLDIEILMKVPDKPLVYWLNEIALKSFVERKLLGEICMPVVGLQTGDNKRFVRSWSEVSFKKINFYCNTSSDAIESKCKWFPYNKGGEYRKWYGNNNDVVNWENNGYEIRNIKDNLGKIRSRPQNENYYFREGIVYSLFGFENFGVRYKENGFLFDVSGSSLFPENWEIILAYLCSNVSFYFLKALAPTVNFQVGDLARIPLPDLNIEEKDNVNYLSRCCVDIVKESWDSSELSWNFKKQNVMSWKNLSFSDAVANLLNYQFKKRELLRSYEEQINLIMINNFELKDEVSKTVLDRDLSLDISSEKNVCKDFISYSVGCIFGRYSIDKEGLLISNQGEKLKDYFNKVPTPTFIPDDDNIVPVLQLDWFEDDITARFKRFLRITFGDENFEKNISYIETIMGKDIRKYFLNDFYKDHVKVYKKRPIYWMFSSPKGSFSALIYIHRYHRDNISVLLEKYLREFLLKLRAEKNTLERLEISSTISSLEKNRAMQKIQKIDSIIIELDNWEKEVIFPLASQRLEIDLDDGIKINYPKFGTALKKFT